MGAVTAFANPQSANKEMSNINGIMICFGTIAIVFDFLILIE